MADSTEAFTGVKMGIEHLSDTLAQEAIGHADDTCAWAARRIVVRRRKCVDPPSFANSAKRFRAGL